MRSGTSFTTAIAAIVGAAVLGGAPTVATAHSPGIWGICPAIDTESLCSPAVPAKAIGPGTSSSDATADLIDIPDYDCAEWRNPVVACPGAHDVTEQASRDSCVERTKRINACPW